MQKSETLEIEMERKGVLLVATPSLLLAIDPARLTTRPEKDLKSQMPSPPVFKVLNMVANGFPYGMRFFVRESKLYLVGGEKSAEGVSMEQLYYEEDDIEVDSSFGTQGASPYIYVSDLTTPDSITDLCKLPTAMLGPKPNPYIAEVEGKIYVLYGNPYFYPQDDILFPTFEVYDPSVGQWEALPDPPFYPRENWIDVEEFEVHAISVMGTSIYVKAGKNYHSYNVNTKIWDSLGSKFSATPLIHPMQPCIQPAKIVPPYDDIFIGLHSATAFAVLIHSDGTSPSYQFLDEVFDEYYKYNLISSSRAVISMGEKEMCVIMAGIWEGKHTTAYITTFRIEKLHASAQTPAVTSAEGSSAPAPKRAKRAKTIAASAPVQDSDELPPFLSVTCLTKGFYNLHAWGLENPVICSAYFHSWSVFNLFLSVHFYIIFHYFVSISMYYFSSCDIHSYV